MDRTAFCIFENGDKFISPISSGKLAFRDCQTQLVGKRADISITHFMSHGIVDDTQVI